MLTGDGHLAAIVVGGLVAAAVHLGFAPVGRRVRELRPRDGAGGAVRTAATVTGPRAGGRHQEKHPDRRDEHRVVERGPRRGRLLRPGRGTDLPVRVTVLQVVALLRAGSGPGAAWSRAAGVPVDLAGVPDTEALSRLLGARNARAVVAATRLALEVGAPLGQVLESVADSLAREAEARAEHDAAIAGPRTTARVIAWLPVVGAGLGGLLGADPLGAATGGGAGTVAALAGLTLLAAGQVWSGRLVAQARGRAHPGEPDVQVLLDLLAAALRAGAGVPRALAAAGLAIGPNGGAALRAAADALVLGAGWDQAWADAPEALAPVGQALRGAWVDGAAPAEALRAAGQELRRRRSAAARTAAARLGVRLVLPLGCCYLPAFVLVGLVPVLLALGIGLVAG